MYRVCLWNASRRGLATCMRPLSKRFVVHAQVSAEFRDTLQEQLHKDALDESKCNKKVYKEWASDYDEYVGSLKYNGPTMVASRALSHFANRDLKRPLKLLDAACGTGLVAKEILNASDAVVSMHGCDYSEDMLDIAKPLYETVRAVDMNQGLPQYPDNEFDIVTCVGAFLEGHVFPNPALKECLRVTADDGVVLLTVRTSFFESHFKQALLDLHHIADISVESFQYLDGVTAELVTLHKKKKKTTTAAETNAKKNAVAMLGVGRMGRPMARLLLKDGYTVYLYDKHPPKLLATDELTALGGEWRVAPSDAARDADFVITNLPLPRDVEDVMAGSGNTIAAMKPGAVWADFSTTDYHVTLRVAEKCRQRDVLPLEIPVTNLHQLGAEVANASFYAAGSREGFLKVRDELNVLSAASFFVSDQIGKAQTIKLLTNLTFYSGKVIGAEAIAACQRVGIPAEYAWQYFCEQDSLSMAMRHFTPCLLDGSYDHSCSLEVAIKDINLTVALDREFGANGSSRHADRVLPAVCDMYNEIGTHYDEDKWVTCNHMHVNALTEQSNNLQLRAARDGWTGPSPHGANSSYAHSTFYQDGLGRKQPVIPESFYDAEFVPSAEQQRVLDTMRDWLTYTNYLAYLDAEALATGMQLDPHELITWSVGCSWVSDHLVQYSSQLLNDKRTQLLKSVQKTIQDLELNLACSAAIIQQELARYGGDAADDDDKTSAVPASLLPFYDNNRLILPEPVFLDTLSMSKLQDGDSVETARMVKALQTRGIAFLDGISMPVSLQQETFDACLDFFTLPEETKLRYASAHQSVYPANCRGFVPVAGETLHPSEGPCMKEVFDLGVKSQQSRDSLPFIGPTVLPDDTTAPGFANKLHALQRIVLQQVVPAVASCLDAEFPAQSKENSVSQLLRDATLIQRVIHYPPFSASFAGCHTDNGLFTVLFFTGKPPQILVDGEWRHIYSVPGVPVLFAGDLLEHWTNGEIVSAQHRVRLTGNTADSRLSLPFFVYPNIESSVRNLRTDEARCTKDFMLQNFEGIWEKGTGAGLSTAYRSQNK